MFPRKKEKPDHRLFSVPVREIPGVELYLKQKLKLNMNKNILLVKLKAAFNIKIFSNLIRTTKFSKVSIKCQNLMAKSLHVFYIYNK